MRFEISFSKFILDSLKKNSYGFKCNIFDLTEQKDIINSFIRTKN